MRLPLIPVKSRFIRLSDCHGTLCVSLRLCNSFRLVCLVVSVFSITEQCISRRTRPVYEMPRKCNSMLAQVVFCVYVWAVGIAHGFRTS